MSWFYRTFIRPALFAQDSEAVHDHTLRALSLASRKEVLCDALATFFSPPALPITAFGLHFENPVGLAAGMDKKAAAVPVWESLGFGFSELGGVTWHPQPGNSAPRLFRAVPDGALINRMGFNNPGAEALAQTLAAWRKFGRWPKHPVGINLGKSGLTPLDRAAEDYASSFRMLAQHADFFVVNVSSPNTPGLRQLQDRAALDEILGAIQEVNGQGLGVRGQRSEVRSQESEATGQWDVGERVGPQVQNSAATSTGLRPVLVKVAPDLSFDALDEILEIITLRGIAGVVATNTTIERPKTNDARLNRIYAETGGLSGRPLRARSTEVVRHLFRQTKGRLPIVGVGGIFNADDAWKKITAGATLIQIYTGLVYEGPSLAHEIVVGLRQRMEDCGMRHLKEAVGTEA
jgi:dihydroorotate dehydrogenase